MPVKFNIHFFFTLSLVLLAYTAIQENDKPDSIKLTQIETELLFKIPKPGNQDFFFGRIRDVKVLPNGTFAVLDDIRKRIHLFSQEGIYMGSVLNEGRGPGEVMLPNGILQIYNNGKISIYDQGLQRISIYKLVGNELTVIQDVNIDRMIYSHFLLPEGALVLYEPKPLWEKSRKDRLLLYNLYGDIINSRIAEFEENEQLILSPFSSEISMGISSQYHTKNLVCFRERNMIYNRSDKVGFTVYDLDTGEVINEVKISRPRIFLPIDKWEELIDEIIGTGVANRDQRSRLLAEMPEYYPMVQSIKCDSLGQIWLSVTEDIDQANWIVFTESGKLIGKLSTEFGEDVISIHKGFIFSKSEDKDGNASLLVYQYNIN